MFDNNDKINNIVKLIDDWYGYWTENFERGNDNIKFARGEQWNSIECSEYSERKKIMLTTNVLYSYILNIVGDQRQNTTQFIVKSKGTNDSMKDIKLIEGILREIAYSSSADTIYSDAFKSALIRGYGGWLIKIKSQDFDQSFDKEIILENIKDPSRIYFDPNSKEKSKNDGDYAGYFTAMSERKFKTLYPDIENPRSFDFQSISSNPFMMWQNYNTTNTNMIIINHHYEKEWEYSKIFKLSNGEEIIGTQDDADKRIAEINSVKSKLEDKMTALNAIELYSGNEITDWKRINKIKIVDDKKIKVCRIKYTESIKNNILEENYFPGIHLPVIYLDGDSDEIDGKEETRPFINDSKDAQRLLNSCISESAQYLKEAKRQKFLITPTHISGFEKNWKNPEVPSIGLPFNPDPMAGNASTPIPIQQSEIPSSLMNMPNVMLSLIQSILGRYEANQGSQGSEVSRVAIAKREQTGNTTVFIYRDNLNKAIEWSNKVCLGLIPHVYLENKYITLRGKDKKSESITLTKEEIDKLKKTKLTVEVTVGPSFQMQKADNYSQLIQLASLDPQRLSQLLGDLIAENTDLPNTPQIVDRFKNFYVPPQVIAKEAGKPPPSPPPPPPPDPSTQAQIQSDKLESISKVISSIADIKKANASLENAKTEQNVTNTRAKAEITKAELDYITSLSDAKILALEEENAKLRQELTAKEAKIGEFLYP